VVPSMSACGGAGAGCALALEAGQQATLAVAVVCVPTDPRSFREIGDQVTDLQQVVLVAVGGVPSTPRRGIQGRPARSESGACYRAWTTPRWTSRSAAG
jgi:hypothetical protein